MGGATKSGEEADGGLIRVPLVEADDRPARLTVRDLELRGLVVSTAADATAGSAAQWTGPPMVRRAQGK